MNKEYSMSSFIEKTLTVIYKEGDKIDSGLTPIPPLTKSLEFIRDLNPRPNLDEPNVIEKQARSFFKSKKNFKKWRSCFKKKKVCNNYC